MDILTFIQTTNMKPIIVKSIGLILLVVCCAILLAATATLAQSSSELEQLHHERLDLLLQKEAILPHVRKLRDIDSRIVEIDEEISKQIDDFSLDGI